MSHLANTFTRRSSYTVSRRYSRASLLRRREKVPVAANIRVLLRIGLVLALSGLCWVGVGYAALAMYRLVAH